MNLFQIQKICFEYKRSVYMKRIICAADNEDFAVAKSGGWTTYDVSTNAIPIIDVDAYGGSLSSFFYDSDKVVLDRDLDAFWNQVVTESMDIIQDSFNELGIPAKVVSGSGSMYHPSYYNFSSDELNFSISVDDGWVTEEFEEYKDDNDFLNFLHEKYSSRSGFISFFPSDRQEFIEAFESGRDKWKAVCQIITYQFDNGIYEENSETLVERMSENPDFDVLYLDSSPSGEHSGDVEELIEDYKANPDSWTDIDVDWLQDYAEYANVPFE